MRARVLGLLVVALVAAGAGAEVRAAQQGQGPDPPVLERPVPGRVLAGFDAPTRYGPGHRGVDLAAPVGSAVRAAAAGEVSFAGRVVDATWVTVDHGTLRTTVGPLRTVEVRRGDTVARGAVLGTSGHAHGRAAVHWSARRGDTYVDPLDVGRAVGLVATLLPTRRVADPAGTAPPWPRTRVR